MFVDLKTVVSMKYMIFNSNGELLDACTEQPAEYIQGYGQILPLWEKNMLGKEKGKQYRFIIDAENAYGEKHECLISKVPLNQFEKSEQLEKGMKLEAKDEKGIKRQVVVKDIEKDHVIIDANHPLAGDLYFQVDVVDIKPLTGVDLEDLK